MLRYTTRLLIIFTLFFSSTKMTSDIYERHQELKFLRQMIKWADDPRFVLWTLRKNSESNKFSDTSQIKRRSSLDLDNANNNKITDQKDFLNKLAKFNSFMKTNVAATNYFHDEMRRMLRQRVVKDNLRKMITLLERVPPLKAEIIEYFRKMAKNVIKISDFYTMPVNDLRINQLGVIDLDSTMN